MYKNYKIDSDGKPKYNGTQYRIAPERRSTETTLEWKKRLEGNGSKAHRRRVVQKKSSSSIKVIHLVYIICFVLVISVINMIKPNKVVNIIQTSSININVNGAITDIGNQLIKPSTGNMFLHIDLNLENTSKKLENININGLILLDGEGNKYRASYDDYQSEVKVKEIGAKSNVLSKLTFEVPLDYKGELALVFEESESTSKDIMKYNIQ